MNEKEPKKMEDIDWDALENEDNLKYAGKDVETYDEKAIKAEKNKLSEEEKNSPYPDDFLADINLLNKDITESSKKLSPNKDEEESN